MPDYNGVDTSNVFAALEDDVEKEKEKDGKDEKKKDATVPRKKTDKKDKEKHGKQSAKAAPATESTRAKKHEGFDRAQVLVLNESKTRDRGVANGITNSKYLTMPK